MFWDLGGVQTDLLDLTYLYSCSKCTSVAKGFCKTLRSLRVLNGPLFLLPLGLLLGSVPSPLVG